MKPKPTLHRARWVLPAVEPPIEGGAVAVREGLIEQVGKFSEIKDDYPSECVNDLGDATLLPGLVNAHAHLDNSAFEGKAPLGEGDFVAWIDALLTAKDETSQEKRREATAVACRLLPRLGTIAVGDISPTAYSPAFLAEEQIRGNVFIEVTGFNKERAESTLLEAEEKLPALEKEPAYNRLRFSVNPHALYSTHESVVKKIFMRNFQERRITSIHLSESVEEVQFLTGESDRFAGAIERWGFTESGWKPPGLTPVRLMDNLGFLRPGVITVHCVSLDDEELELLARSGVSVCLCPRSNDNIGVGQPRIAEMLAVGIEPCLGTDGLGSVQSLSVFDEMAFVRSRHPELKPELLLRMATVNGARALRFDSVLGALKTGLTGRILSYTGDVGREPLEALTSGIDHDKIHWV